MYKRASPSPWVSNLQYINTFLSLAALLLIFTFCRQPNISTNEFFFTFTHYPGAYHDMAGVASKNHVVLTLVLLLRPGSQVGTHDCSFKFHTFLNARK